MLSMQMQRSDTHPCDTVQLHTCSSSVQASALPRMAAQCRGVQPCRHRAGCNHILGHSLVIDQIGMAKMGVSSADDIPDAGSSILG